MINFLKSWAKNFKFYMDINTYLFHLSIYSFKYNKNRTTIKMEKRRGVPYYWSTICINFALYRRTFYFVIPYKRTKL